MNRGVKGTWLPVRAHVARDLFRALRETVDRQYSSGSARPEEGGSGFRPLLAAKWFRGEHALPQDHLGAAAQETWLGARAGLAPSCFRRAVPDQSSCASPLRVS